MTRKGSPSFAMSQDRLLILATNPGACDALLGELGNLMESEEQRYTELARQAVFNRDVAKDAMVAYGRWKGLEDFYDRLDKLVHRGN